MQPPPSTPDFVSFVAAIVSVFVTQPIARAMGVYSGIFIGACLGAAIAVYMARNTTVWRAVGLFVVMFGVSVIGTVPAAHLINRTMGTLHANLQLPELEPLISLLSVVLAAIGTHWPRVARSAWGALLWVFRRRYAGPPPQDRPTPTRPMEGPPYD